MSRLEDYLHTLDVACKALADAGANPVHARRLQTLADLLRRAFGGDEK